MWLARSLSAAETILSPGDVPRFCAHGILRAKPACTCVRVRAHGDARLSPAEEAQQYVGVEVEGESRGVVVVGGAVPINQARLQRRRDLQLPSQQPDLPLLYVT